MVAVMQKNPPNGTLISYDLYVSQEYVCVQEGNTALEALNVIIIICSNYFPCSFIMYS